MKKLYIVFQTTKSVWDYKAEKHLATEAEFQGVYDDKEKAINACKNELWWIGIANLNEALPDESCEWNEYIVPYEKKDA
jgi:hypothetical protein